jgi:hypothetical protein
MRVERLGLPVGTRFDFALEGPMLECRGLGRVVHIDGDTTGIAVERWIDTDCDHVGAMVMSHLLSQMGSNELFIPDWR